MRRMSRVSLMVAAMVSLLTGTVSIGIANGPAARADGVGGPIVGAGLVISTSPRTGQRGHCVLTLAGRDRVGALFGLTAGHCATLGSTVRSADGRTQLGTVVARKSFPSSGVFEPEYLDYALIRLRPDARPAAIPGSPVTAGRIGAPRTGMIACKFGNGFVFAGERCGVIGRVSAIEFDVTAFSIFGDSGGPVYLDRHTVIGIVSRPSAVPFASPSTMTRVDAVVADAVAEGMIRGVLTPLS